MNAPNDTAAAALMTELPLDDPAERQAAFVAWLRRVAPYIHAFRGKTFVVAFAGELVEAGRLETLVHDVSLLHALGMRIVLVHGMRPQIQQQLALRNIPARFVDGLRVTDDATLECVLEAAGELRLTIEAMFSQGLANTPMQHAQVRVMSGNFITARPVGIVNGVDFEHTGVVRKIAIDAIRHVLDAGSIVQVSPLGFSPTGEAFNLTMEDVAAAVAISLDADKLMFLTESPGVLDENGKVRTEISEADAQELLADGVLPHETAFYLRHALKACMGGVARAHILPFALDGSVLLEIFTHDGVGSMVVEETLEELREATLDDVAAILKLIEPMEQDGTLVRRGRHVIESEIDRFTVIEHDGVLFGCVALYPFPGSRMGEMACLTVIPEAQGQGDGERLLKRVEQRARAMGLDRLFVLTTRTSHWFQKRGFVPADVTALPPERAQMYNWQRKSQVLIKKL